MTLLTGLAAQLGIAEESTYGTSVTPTRFIDFNTENVNLQIDRMESKGLRAGQRVLRSDRWVPNRKGASGDLEFEFASKGMGLFIKHALGGVPVITTPASGILTRQQTTKLADPTGLSLTMQVGRPGVAGTVQPFTYLGTKIDSSEWSVDVDGILTVKLTVDAMDESTGVALAAPSYPAVSEVLTYAGGVLQIGGTPTDVKKFSLKVDQGLKTDRYFIRGNTLKKPSTPAGMASITGDIEAEFTDLTLYNRFTAGTTAALILTFTGSAIETVAGPITYFNKLVITLPVCRFDGDTPNVTGPDVLTQPLKIKALDDGTASAPIQMDYFSVDTVA